MNKIAKVLNYIADFKLTRHILSFKNNGYLVEIGWFNSLKQKEPSDKNSKPLPWVTYSFIEFIKPYLTKETILFEYGSGNSTLFYASFVKKVSTVEHNKDWFDKLQQKLPENVENIFMKIEEKYPESILNCPENFDIIVIDGRRRNKCILFAIRKLKQNGIIVLDDSERERYKDGIKILEENNFKKIDFWGIAPGFFHNKCTSVFCKNFDSFL